MGADLLFTKVLLLALAGRGKSERTKRFTLEPGSVRVGAAAIPAATKGLDMSARSTQRTALLTLTGLVCSWIVAFGQDRPTDSGDGQTLYYIPHTHWEGAVFKTREEYLEMGLPHILTALQLLK